MDEFILVVFMAIAFLVGLIVGSLGPEMEDDYERLCGAVDGVVLELADEMFVCELESGELLGRE